MPLDDEKRQALTQGPKPVEGAMSFGDPIIDLMQRISSWAGYSPSLTTTQAAQMVPGTEQLEKMEPAPYSEYQRAFREDPLGQTAQYAYPEHYPQIAAGKEIPKGAVTEAAFRMMRAGTPEALAGVAVREAGGTPTQAELAEVFTPGPGDVTLGVKAASVFGSPQVSGALRKGAATWLAKARPSIYKKGTRLGDLFRKIGYAPGKEASTVLQEMPKKELLESFAKGGAINIGGKNIGQEDLAAIMNILGHEKGHILYNRARALGRHNPEAKQIADLLEDAAVAATGFRRPGSVMQTSVASTKWGQPFREAERMTLRSPRTASQVDRPHPQGRMLREELGIAGEKRLSERVADLLSELTTFKGQQGLNPKQREFLSAIMDLY